MTNYQKALLSCFKLTVADAKKFPKSLALIPQFEKGILKLETLTLEIDALRVKQEKDTKGITADINLVFAQLKDYMIDTSGALQSYATDKNNNTLFASINFTENAIHNLSKKDIIAISSRIIEEADKLTAEELLAYGVSAEDMTELKRLHKVIDQDGQAPKHAKIESSGFTDELGLKVNEAYKLKKNKLDKLSTQFKRKDMEFYKRYTTASNFTYKRSGRNNGDDQNDTTTGDDEVKK
jgi:hypothetical protein